MDWLYKDLAASYSEIHYGSKFSILPVHKVVTILSAIFFFHSVHSHAIRCYPDISDIRKRESFVCLTHSVIASGLASYVLLFHHSLWDTPSSYSEPIVFCDVIFPITYGFFIWDVYNSFAEGHSIDFKIHAILCFVVYAFITFTPFMHRQGLIVLLFEVSTIFLHCSRIVERNGHKVCGQILLALFAVSFFVFRIIIGLFVSYEIFGIFAFDWIDVEHSEVPSWFYRTALIVNGLFTILNIVWFERIIQKAIRMVRSLLKGEPKER